MRSSLRGLRDDGRWQKLSILLSGSLVLLFGSALVSVVNFGYNVSMARMLGPELFGSASAIVTLFMLCSAITLSFQLVCAKFVARIATEGGKLAASRFFMERAWGVGLAMGLIAALCSRPIANFLRLPSASLVIALAVGFAFYVPLGVKRGTLQGLCKFPQLTWNFALEALSKFIAALILVYIGYGALGAVGAVSISVIIALFMPIRSFPAKVESEKFEMQSFQEGMQAIIFFIGQVVINNIDILLVKHYFSPAAAGMYAAVALVGRVLYFAAWQIVSAMFPVSAAKPEEHNLHVLIVPLLGVLLICAVFIAAMGIFPGLIVHLIFGELFASAQPLLLLYAVATGLYALSVVLMAYEMSRKIANTGWLQLLFSGVLVIAIAIFHETLRQVILVQIVLMVLLLLVVMLPFLKTFRAHAHLQEAA
ncbi:MAG TPA: oligosaccharide flippase family protein [Terriglobales bacterium]